MNRRVLVAALAALLVLPAGAAGQIGLRAEGTEWTARFRVTPFIGHLTGFDRTVEWSYTDTTGVRVVESENSIASGTAFGVNAEFPLYGRLGGTVAFAFAQRDRTGLLLSTGQAFEIDGNDVYLARAAVRFRLVEENPEFVLRRLGASAHAGVTFMREDPQNSLGTAQYTGTANHYGVNLGLSGEMPFADDRFAVQVGIEDNIMWWSDTQSSDFAVEYLRQRGIESDVVVNSEMSHAWLFRAGVSIRIH